MTEADDINNVVGLVVGNNKVKVYIDDTEIRNLQDYKVTYIQGNGSYMIVSLSFMTNKVEGIYVAGDGAEK